MGQQAGRGDLLCYQLVTRVSLLLSLVTSVLTTPRSLTPTECTSAEEILQF